MMEKLLRMARSVPERDENHVRYASTPGPLETFSAIVMAIFGMSTAATFAFEPHSAPLFVSMAIVWLVVAGSMLTLLGSLIIPVQRTIEWEWLRWLRRHLIMYAIIVTLASAYLLWHYKG